MLAALTALTPVASAAPAGEDDGRCDGRILSPREREIQVQQQQRRNLGLPSSRRHVIRVLSDPRYRRPNSSFPLTPLERRFLGDRGALAARVPEIDRYARRHAPGAYGGTTAESRFPGPAFFRARFTRDVDRHARALRTRIDREVEVRQVRFTHTYLRRLQDQIDIEALERRRIRFASAGVSVPLNRVRLEVVTARRDVHRVVERLYGPGVRVVVLARREERRLCLTADSYSISADGRELTVYYWTPTIASRFHRLAVDDSGGRIRVGVHERVQNGYVPPACQFRAARIELDPPLAGRAVIDAETGRRLPTGSGRPRVECRDRYGLPPPPPE